jgi:hypothetical protein
MAEARAIEVMKVKILLSFTEIPFGWDWFRACESEHVKYLKGNQRH